MPEVSVLVAVYNAADTLARCLDSLLNQTLPDVQIICIDDASSDASPHILCQYKQKHPHCIDLITLPENHGQAYARNQGIPLIRAPYTTILDSDDYLAPDALQQVVETFNKYPNTDSVLFDVRYIYSDGHEHGYRTTPFQCMKGYDAFIKSLSWEIHGWNVARTTLYQQFPFDEASHTYSDDNTMMAHYLHSREVRCCPGKYYYYQNENSCTHLVSIRRFDLLSANESLHQQLLAWNIDPDITISYEKLRWDNLLDCFWFYNRNRLRFTPTQQKKALQKLHHAWNSIDTSHLPLRTKLKPGYMPLHPFWTLFVWQEWALYMFRKLRYDQNGRRKSQR